MKVKVGANIKKARKAEDMTAKALALVMNVPANTLSRIETGRIYPSVSQLIVICSYLGVSPNDILDI